MIEIGAREVISIMKRKGIKISYGYLLQLTRRGDVPIIRTERCPGGKRYIYSLEDILQFIKTKTGNCIYCGKPTVCLSGFCSKRCEQLYYRGYPKRQGQHKHWTESCPFHNGSIRSHIPGVDPLSADFCPLI
jgi:hypothetical protein